MELDADLAGNLLQNPILTLIPEESYQKTTGVNRSGIFSVQRMSAE